MRKQFHEMEKIFNQPDYKQRRKELRQNTTDAESALWQRLRNKQLG